MTMSNALSIRGQSIASRACAHDVELEEQLYETFVKMRNLLEEYAPLWYPEELHESSQAIVELWVR